MLKAGNIFNILGVMSGTSLDGLDLALCSFKEEENKWIYNITKAETIVYSKEWRQKLSEAHTLSAADLTELDHGYGKWIAAQCIDFLGKTDIKPDLIASHGHTVFHQPGKGYSLQIGNGNDIAALTAIPVIFDFRSLDIALGGQGAPLVPAGDELLFPEYDSCLNLGGFSNISFRYQNRRIAYDICPVNIILNRFAAGAGLLFDKDGAMGKKGKVKEKLLAELNDLSFYKLPPPRTLMREWLEKELLPLFEAYNNLPDLLRTSYEHITDQLAKEIRNYGEKKILVTGGGAKNIFLVSLLREKCKTDQELFIPDNLIIDYKEAMIFGFLGLLRYLGRINCFASVTGAVYDSSCGLIAGLIKKDAP